MPELYGMRGSISGEWLSYGGRVLVHHDPAEMAFLFHNVRVERFRRDDLPTLAIRFHPELAHLSWPLQRDQFRKRADV